jgi:hypothetical protein
MVVFVPIVVLGQRKPSLYPKEVEIVLNMAGKNRNELVKAIQYYKKISNPLKLKAIYFLISNMDIHYSEDYFWADDLNRKSKFQFNELAYKDFSTASLALDSFTKGMPDLHPERIVLPDVENITAAFLINNVEEAFQSWKMPWARNISFTDFCEYILPYRESIEPLQNWRSVYKKKFQWITDSAKYMGVEKTLSLLAKDYRINWKGTYNQKTRQLLPRLGSLQLIFRKEGDCSDMVDLLTFTLRSQGIPVSSDIITYWATSTDRHFMNDVFDDKMNPIRFDPFNAVALNGQQVREPAKVLRNTYSKQKTTLANFEKQENIPDGFLQRFNYIDVTNLYWKTADVKCKLFSRTPMPQIAYVSIFNGGDWRPTWWGKIKNDSVSFSSMCKGAVFLPIYYINGNIEAAGYPIVVGYNNELVLEPDTINKRTITINEEDKYLFFRPDKNYQLFYWDTDWKLIEEKKAIKDMHSMQFDNVPKNCLLRLVPEYSQGKERPFIITEEGKRYWW